MAKKRLSPRQRTNRRVAKAKSTARHGGDQLNRSRAAAVLRTQRQLKKKGWTGRVAPDSGRVSTREFVKPGRGGWTRMASIEHDVYPGSMTGKGAVTFTRSKGKHPSPYFMGERNPFGRGLTRDRVKPLPAIARNPRKSGWDAWNAKQGKGKKRKAR